MRLNNLIAGHITNWTKKYKKERWMEKETEREPDKQKDTKENDLISTSFFHSQKLTSKFT